MCGSRLLITKLQSNLLFIYKVILIHPHSVSCVYMTYIRLST